MSKPSTHPLVTSLRNHNVLREREYNTDTTSNLYIRERPRPYLFCINEVTYSQPFDEKWTDIELINAIIELYCRGDWSQRLTDLPDLPNCRLLDCSANALTSLPRLDACVILNCSLNKLTTLGPLPKCTYIMADDNDIREIGPLPSCERLYCRYNPISFIQPSPNIVMIQSGRMDIRSSSDNIDHWTRRWAYLRKKYLRLWYLGMLKCKSNRKRELHEELRFSPDTLIENEYTLAKQSFERKLQS